MAQPPTGSSVRLRSPTGAPAIDWWVQWDDEGVRHSVTVRGVDVAPDHANPVSWSAGAAEHEQPVLQILCRLLRAVEQASEGAPRRRRNRRASVEHQRS